MLRTVKERVLQVVCFEVGGLLISVPIFAYFTKMDEPSSFLVLIILSIVVMCWTGIHNFLYDCVEFRMTQRVASDRPNRLRLIHAVSHEVSSIVFCLPLLVWLAELSWREAFIADIGLTVLYTVYAFLFYQAYDVLRPVNYIPSKGF